jgi:predicted RNase H-like nuclease (RuvC/YqgF family)
MDSSAYALQAVKGIKFSFDNAVKNKLQEYMEQGVIKFYQTSEITEIYTSTEGLNGSKELAELEAYEKTLQEPTKEETSTRVKTRAPQLSYKDKLEYEKLPAQIEELENKIKQINTCLGDPECYAQKGVVTLSNELEEAKATLDQKVERFLEIEMKIEEIATFTA